MSDDASKTIVDGDSRLDMQFSTTADDYLALLRLHLEKTALGRRFATFAWIAISALAWLSVLLPYLKFGTIDWGFGIRVALATSVTVGFPLFYRWYNDGVFRQIVNETTVRGLAGPTSLIADATGIEQRTTTTSAHARWHDISGIVSTSQHDFVSLAPLVTVMIPARVFASAEARRDFQMQVAAWCAEARVRTLG